MAALFFYLITLEILTDLKEAKLFADNLHDEFALARAVIKIHKYDLLPGSQGQFAGNEWDGERGA